MAIFADVRTAVVVHLGTMIGGHYIAYCLVDPGKMFEDATMTTDGMTGLSLNGGYNAETAPKKDRRVWCYCSE